MSGATELQSRTAFRISSYDVDAFGELRASTLMSFFQEAGRLHSQRINLSVAELNKVGKTWVLAQFRLDYRFHPKVDAEISVLTWPSSRGEWDVVRDFEVTDAQGRIVAVASGTYVIIDLATRKATRLGELVPGDYQFDRQLFESPMAPLSRLDTGDHEIQLPVMMRDLDVNFHVNNVVYVQWALEALPYASWERTRLVGLDVAYRSEIRFGDSVKVTAALTEAAGSLETRHQVCVAASGVDAARLRARWQPR